jgi:hypothetical protein
VCESWSAIRDEEREQLNKDWHFNKNNFQGQSQ